MGRGSGREEGMDLANWGFWGDWDIRQYVLGLSPLCEVG